MKVLAIISIVVIIFLIALHEAFRIENKQKKMKLTRSGFLLIILVWFGYFTQYNYAIFAFAFYLVTFDILINVLRGKKWNYVGDTKKYHWEKFKHDIMGQKLPYVLWNFLLLALMYISVKNAPEIKKK